MSQRRLLLFDIDGTLGRHVNEGRNAYDKALRRVFGPNASLGLPQVSFAGATDLAILQHLTQDAPETLTPALQETFFDVLHQEYSAIYKQNPFGLFPGVQEMTEHLSKQSEFLLGLVTGNIETCARTKLGAAGLEKRFRFGGFGNEHHDRNELARIALKRANAFPGSENGFSEIWLTGDTPKDIEAAKTIGAKAVAISSHHYSREDLQAHQPDWVIDDIRELLELLKTSKDS